MLFKGSFTITANGVLSGTLMGLESAFGSTTDVFTLYLMDTTRGAVIQTDCTGLTLGYVQLQQ